MADEMHGELATMGQSSQSPESDVSSQAPRSNPPNKSISPSIRRVLRTRVPLVVTLAQKNETAAKVLQLGPGSIIEFDQNCEEPLQLSINNLPIGYGEAVKIDDHFGLRILNVLSVKERAERLGGKWAY